MSERSQAPSLFFYLPVLLFIVISGCSAISSVGSRFSGNAPHAANMVAKALDEQLTMRYATKDPDDDRDPEAVMRSQILIMGTTPVNVNNLAQSCPLARQMTEEVSSRLMALGYRYEELRRGRVIRFDQRTGELLLTRDVSKLINRAGYGQLILVGTYIISDRSVRFNFSLIHSQSNEVMAKTSISVPITGDIISLIDESPIRLPGDRSPANAPSTYIWMR